jgi:hypothetical protein
MAFFLERGAHRLDQLRGPLGGDGIERGFLRLEIITNPLIHTGRMQKEEGRMKKKNLQNRNISSFCLQPLSF